MARHASIVTLVATIIVLDAHTVAVQAQEPEFEQVALPSTAGKQYTSVCVGPDSKLYGAADDGEIRRWPLNPDGTTGATEIISSLTTAEGGPRLLVALAFDPGSSADNLIAWISHTTYGFSGMADWGGKLTRLSGPNLETVQDYVINLPRSSRDHATNGIDFGPDGAIYFLQGSNSAMGAPDAAWSNRPERLLSAAVLRFDPSSVNSPPLNAKTEAGGSYDPYAPGAPLTIYATGTRNAYDLVWHSNGQLYVPTNGSAPGGNTPAGVPGAACAEGGTYSGPFVPQILGAGVQSDFLFRIEQGGYYGHPNPLRCEFVANGGNPTAGPDPAEVSQYPVGTLPDADYAGFAFDFGPSASPDGIIEYQHGGFAGALQHKLLAVRYSVGDDVLVLTPGGPDFDIVSSQTGIVGLTGFSDPLDLAEDLANGNLYISEYGAAKITLARPIPSEPAGVPATNHATSDYATQWGSIASGSYLNTHTQDDSYEALIEEQTNGPPSRRRSRLSHTWTFEVAAGSSQVFFVDAYHTPNSEGDDFRFSYSLDNAAYTPMLTVTKTSDDNALQAYFFPTSLAGTLYVKVQDTDQTQGNSGQDTVYVDEMYVLTSSGSDTTPPAAPTGLTPTPGDGSVSLDWDDNGEGDLAGYNIYRSTTSGGPFAQLNGPLASTSSSVDTTAINGTTYYYVVTAVDTSNNESGNSSEASATPQGEPPVSLHVASIVLGTINQGQGFKSGTAAVAIYDDQGNPVAGAEVSGTFTGDYNESEAQTTNASGVALLITNGTKKGKINFQFCVTDVLHAALPYAPEDNAQTCSSMDSSGGATVLAADAGDDPTIGTSGDGGGACGTSCGGAGGVLGPMTLLGVIWIRRRRVAFSRRA